MWVCIEDSVVTVKRDNCFVHYISKTHLFVFPKADKLSGYNLL